MACAAIEARRLGLTVEEADAVHTVFGIPRTGVFGLFDLIGIDLIPQVWASLMDSLPAEDRLQRFDLPGDSLTRRMIDAGRLGRKAGGGFYRKGAEGKEALDLVTLEYRPVAAVDPKALPGGGRDPGALLQAEDKLGAYARAVFGNVLAYAAQNGPEIAADVGAVDTAVTLGYAWRRGPFALADAVGLDRTAQVVADVTGASLALLDAAREAGGFYDGEGRVLATSADRAVAAPTAGAGGLAGLRGTDAPVCGNDAASLWDIGGGIGCFELHTKMNAFTPAVLDALDAALSAAPGRFAGLVLGNDDARAFSVGADLGTILGHIEADEIDKVADFVARGQRLFLAMQRSDLPVVAALHGFALGGGCEFALHADTIVAHAELKAGLPEISVGIVPAWGGCTQLLLREGARTGDPVTAAGRSFDTIFGAAHSGSALQAREMAVLRPWTAMSWPATA